MCFQDSAIESYEHGICKIEILPDSDDAFGPFGWDNVGNFYMRRWRSDLTIGRGKDFSNIQKAMREAIYANAHINGLIFRVHDYDRYIKLERVYPFKEGIVEWIDRDLSQPEFDIPTWDGVYWIDRDEIVKEWGKERKTYRFGDNKPVRLSPTAMAERCMNGTAETISQWLSGDVYGYVVSLLADENVSESCWGFYGLEDCKQEAERIAEGYEQREKEAAKFEASFMAC